MTPLFLGGLAKSPPFWIFKSARPHRRIAREVFSMRHILGWLGAAGLLLGLTGCRATENKEVPMNRSQTQSTVTTIEDQDWKAR